MEKKNFDACMKVMNYVVSRMVEVGLYDPYVTIDLCLENEDSCGVFIANPIRIPYNSKFNDGEYPEYDGAVHEWVVEISVGEDSSFVSLHYHDYCNPSHPEFEETTEVVDGVKVTNIEVYALESVAYLLTDIDPDDFESSVDKFIEAIAELESTESKVAEKPYDKNAKYLYDAISAYCGSDSDLTVNVMGDGVTNIKVQPKGSKYKVAMTVTENPEGVMMVDASTFDCSGERETIVNGYLVCLPSVKKFCDEQAPNKFYPLNSEKYTVDVVDKIEIDSVFEHVAEMIKAL